MSLIDSIAKKNRQSEKVEPQKKAATEKPVAGKPVEPCKCGENTWWQSVYSPAWLCGSCDPPPCEAMMARFVNVCEVGHVEVQRGDCRMRLLSEKDEQWHEGYWSGDGAG